MKGCHAVASQSLLLPPRSLHAGKNPKENQQVYDGAGRRTDGAVCLAEQQGADG